MPDTSHLAALHTRLSHEREYLAKAKTEAERKLRNVWIAGIEKEIAAEYKFLGMDASPATLDDISDDDLLALLTE